MLNIQIVKVKDTQFVINIFKGKKLIFERTVNTTKPYEVADRLEAILKLTQEVRDTIE
jgi:hypothetical protein